MDRLTDRDREIQHFVLPDLDNPYLLARVRWPDVFQAISSARPDWQDDPGLLDLPYSPSSTPVSVERAAAIAAEWGGHLPADDDTRVSRRALMRRMPADWSNLSRAERRAWAIEDAPPPANRALTRRERRLAAARRPWRRRREHAPPPSEPTPTPSAAGASAGNGNTPQVRPEVIDLHDTGLDSNLSRAEWRAWAIEDAPSSTPLPADRALTRRELRLAARAAALAPETMARPTAHRTGPDPERRGCERRQRQNSSGPTRDHRSARHRARFDRSERKCGGDCRGSMTTQVPGPSPVPTRPRSVRATDYRLRGLDLDAHVFMQAPSRDVWERHPSRRRHRRRRRLRHATQFVVVLGVIALVAVLLRASVVEPYTVTSSSMAPTLRAGTDVLVMKSGLLAGSIGTGDVVVVKKPAGVTCDPRGDHSSQLVARVIALGGETIRSVRGRIFIDGHRFHKPGWYNALVR